MKDLAKTMPDAYSFYKCSISIRVVNFRDERQSMLIAGNYLQEGTVEISDWSNFFVILRGWKCHEFPTLFFGKFHLSKSDILLLWVDLEKRLTEHNNGKGLSTRGKRPWQLV